MIKREGKDVEVKENKRKKKGMEKRKRGSRDERRKESGRDEWVEGVTIEKRKVKTERGETWERKIKKKLENKKKATKIQNEENKQSLYD